MSTSAIVPDKIVVFTGAGISAPSGIPTFRDMGGLWQQYRFEDVASPEAWKRQPEVVLEFYNQRRSRAAAALPNEAHRAVAALERRYQVVVVTQNVDDLHERAGSSHIVHVHGELTKARSTRNPSLVYDIGSAPIRIGDLCAEGSQLRPHIVWFGENIMNADEAIAHMESAAKVVVVGTSLNVYPAAGFVDFAHPDAEKIIVDVEALRSLRGFESYIGSADKVLPGIVERWLET